MAAKNNIYSAIRKVSPVAGFSAGLTSSKKPVAGKSAVNMVKKPSNTYSSFGTPNTAAGNENTDASIANSQAGSKVSAEMASRYSPEAIAAKNLASTKEQARVSGIMGERFAPKKNVMSNLSVPAVTTANAGADYMQNVLTGNQTPINIESSFNAGDAALARQAEDMRAQTGGALAKADQLGQGQANIEGQRTEQNIMANLTQRESEKSLARINEQKSQQARQDSAAQMLSNYGISRDSLDLQAQGQAADIRFKQMGIDSAKMDRLFELGQGNPILTSKLLQQELDKAGIPYSPSEIETDVQSKMAADALDPTTKLLNSLITLATTPVKEPALPAVTKTVPTVENFTSAPKSDWQMNIPKVSIPQYNPTTGRM